MFEIHDAIEDLPGSTAARRLLVTRALEYLDSLSAQSKGETSLQKELAAAHLDEGKLTKQVSFRTQNVPFHYSALMIEQLVAGLLN